MKTKTSVEIKRSMGTVTLGDLMVGDKFIFITFDDPSIMVATGITFNKYVTYTAINSGKESQLPLDYKVIPVNVEIIATTINETTEV